MSPLSGFNHADYVTQAQKDAWNEICNLDNASNSAYTIDLADLAAFCEDDPQVWLWEACWRDNYVEMYGMTGGGESMMMASPMMPASAFSASQPTSSKTELFEPVTIEQEIMVLEDIIEILEKIWLEDPYIQEEIDSKAWEEFMDSVYDSLDEIKTESDQKWY